MKFNFGDLVVVDKNLLGVIVKCNKDNYEVYVKVFENIVEYKEKDIRKAKEKVLNDTKNWEETNEM